MENNKPVINNRDRLLSVSVFKKEAKDDRGQVRTYYSACLQRSFQKPEDKGSDKWQRETINLYPDDLLRLSALLAKTYNDIVGDIRDDVKTRIMGTPAPVQQSTPVAKTTASDYIQQRSGDIPFDDDIPF